MLKTSINNPPQSRQHPPHSVASSSISDSLNQDLHYFNSYFHQDCASSQHIFSFDTTKTSTMPNNTNNNTNAVDPYAHLQPTCYPHAQEMAFDISQELATRYLQRRRLTALRLERLRGRWVMLPFRGYTVLAPVWGAIMADGRCIVCPPCRMGPTFRR